MHGFVISVYYCIINVYVQQQHRATTAHIRSTAIEVRTTQIHYERFGKKDFGILLELSIGPGGGVNKWPNGCNRFSWHWILRSFIRIGMYVKNFDENRTAITDILY
jgi:hypothetical protein